MLECLGTYYIGCIATNKLSDQVNIIQQGEKKPSQFTTQHQLTPTGIEQVNIIQQDRKDLLSLLIALKVYHQAFRTANGYRENIIEVAIPLIT